VHSDLHSVSLFTGFAFDTSPSTFGSPVSRGVLGTEMKGVVYSGAYVGIYFTSTSLPAFKPTTLQPTKYVLSVS
jgi:hypothetical protein